jgi:hypothetical protein
MIWVGMLPLLLYSIAWKMELVYDVYLKAHLCFSSGVA